MQGNNFRLNMKLLTPKQPLNTPEAGGLGKVLGGRMQGTNIFKHKESDYKGKPIKSG